MRRRHTVANTHRTGRPFAMSALATQSIKHLHNYSFYFVVFLGAVAVGVSLCKLLKGKTVQAADRVLRSKTAKKYSGFIP